MIQVLARELHPTMFSLGSSRILWQDASPVSPDTVFYCNLPTRRFYSEAALPDAEVRRLTCHLIGQLRACGHPTSWPWNAKSCMWLAPGATIRRKVEIMLES